ncbi:MAG: hypothetical protein V7609_1919 [Verrucomicrobiota bacterium]
MWDGNPVSYFDIGRSALRCIKVAMLAAEIDTFTNILDLPCGHGRVLRHLQHGFPQARLTACDVNTSGTEFCARAFGATPIQGDESPSRIALQGSYDLIWVGSLLTHLNAQRCADFFDLFRRNLCPNGLLVCTLHGRKVAHRMRSGIDSYGLAPDDRSRLLTEYAENGFGFSSYPSDLKIPGISSDYGISLASPYWVFSQVTQMQEMRLVMYTENAWHDHHDAVSFIRQ